MTNDVEETSITKNRLSSITAKKVAEKGLPRLLSLYSKYDIESTFYFTGTFAEKYPKSVKEVLNNGHEVGCHGYSHRPECAFDVLSLKDQFSHIRRAKKAIEEVAGKIEAFRAPALRIGNETPFVLEKLGFKTDSSVASQRFDGPLTFGSIRKLNWILCPRKPYFLSNKSPYIAGNTSVLEIPVSAFGIGYQGTTMRIAPNLTNVIRGLLLKESKFTKKPIVFIIHPNELIVEKVATHINRRTSSYMGYLFGDLIRNRIKIKNLGRKAEELLETEIRKSIDSGLEFISAKSFRKRWK